MCVTATPAPAPAVEPAPEPAPRPSLPRGPEQLAVLTNARSVLTFTSRGGGLTAVQLKAYRRTVDTNSGPIQLDFSDAPAFVYADTGLQGLDAAADFELQPDPETGGLRLTAESPSGLRLTRRVTFGADYQMVIEEIWSNTAAQAAAVPARVLPLGSMRLDTSGTAPVSGDTLGLDILPASAGEGVKHLGADLPKRFKKQAPPGTALPRAIEAPDSAAIDWLALKNKYFVQILAPEGGAAGFRLNARRAPGPGESDDPARAPRRAVVSELAAGVRLPAVTLAPGAATTTAFRYYAGPKRYSLLRTLGLHQEEVMEFGFWKPLCRFLLFVLNRVYEVIPNYGVAIIVLTVLIRVLFWPLTHKSTESMKRMQALQPLIAELRKKYKDNPRKVQEETMALYRQHKVNPVSGCLPMLIQIPVFIALFVVLRQAIELRFAGFLWIKDLSEPERLLAGVLPIPLNILPLFMAATQYLQQALTPTSDPNQQKMMLYLMPGMMLVMFYMMPSALVLYWSANQVIMIVQQLLQKRHSARAAPARA